MNSESESSSDSDNDDEAPPPKAIEPAPPTARFSLNSEEYNPEAPFIRKPMKPINPDLIPRLPLDNPKRKQPQFYLISSTAHYR